MDNQEFFTKAVAHLREQQAKAKEGEACVYIAPSGLKCAVGGLLPDSLLDKLRADPEFNEGTGVVTLMENFPEAKELFAGVNIDLLRAVQRIHDERPVHSWEEHFQYTAARFNLRMPNA